MSRTFELHIKQGGEWQKVTAVFPFTSADLLDERLDEGSITFFDRVKAHKPLTEVRITFYNNNQPDNDRYGKNTEYFIIANDNSSEYPVGSEVYKHETYIIERTKLLEGILCPSLTFTTIKNKGTIPQIAVYPSDDSKVNSMFLQNYMIELDKYELSLFKPFDSPLEYSENIPISIPSIREVSNAFITEYSFILNYFGNYLENNDSTILYSSITVSDSNGNNYQLFASNMGSLDFPLICDKLLG